MGHAPRGLVQQPTKKSDMLRTLTLSLLLLLTTACATAPSTPDALDGTALSPGIYRVATGVRVTEEALLAELATAPLVYVGETHDNAAHHAVQARIVEGLMRRAPARRVALGLEMFQRPYQSALDAFMKGDLDEAALLQQTEYEKRWGFDFAFYRPMVALAQQRGARIIALNAPSELTRKVAREGLDALNAEERALLPPTLHAENPAHRALFDEVMNSVHAGMDEATLDRFYAAQVIWDATMAMSAVEGLERPEVEQVVVLAGMVHVQGGLGIPFHVQRLKPGVRARIVLPAQATKEAPVFAEEVFGSGDGDFVWVWGE